MNTVMTVPPKIHLQAGNFQVRCNRMWSAVPVEKPLTYALNTARTDVNQAKHQTVAGPAKVAGAPDSVLAMQHRADTLEILICEAETALAGQTVRTYRRWYASWRSRGVRVSDLLDMTWAWHQRSS